MDEHQQNQQNFQLSEAEQIASTQSAKNYFLSQQTNLLDQWGDRSVELFKFTGEVFMKEYEIKSSDLTEKFGQKYQDIYSKCRKQFQAYCILNRKVQKKNDQIQNFAAFFNAKNHKKSFFKEWKAYTDKQKYIRQMDQRSDKYKQNKTLKSCLKSWLNLTMKSNRMKIKNEVLHKTEIQISKIQEQYEKIIKNLQETLQKKLIDLKKEQQEHKLLHNKYESMYARNKMESVSQTQ